MTEDTMSPSRTLTLLLVVLRGAAACSGSIETGMMPGDEMKGTGGDGSPLPGEKPFDGFGGMGGVPPSPMTVDLCKKQSAGFSPMRRLTRLEYTNTIRELLGVTDVQNPGPSFPPDAQVHGFDNAASVQTPSQALVSGYGDAARDLAAIAILTMPKLLGCDTAATGEEPCAKSFIASFGRRAYRRPLVQAEQDRIFTFYAGQRAKYGFTAAIEQLVTAMLQSPNFIYRVEVGTPTAGQTDMIKLTQHEVASRISYLVWESMPDPTLFTAADRGELATSQQVAAQAERMLGSTKAKATVAHFNNEWLHLEAIDDPALTKDTRVYPAFTPAMRGFMKTETSKFLEDVMFGASPTLSTLLTADYTFANLRLASFYKTTGPTTDAAFVKTPLPAGKRAGLLTQASFLTVNAKEDQSSPIARGVFILEQMMCTEPPAPPNDVNVIPPTVQPGTTTRQRFEMHAANPCAAACHMLFDPIGFSFENYDGIGTWRDRDNGFPVNPVGEVKIPEEMAGKYNGAVELATKLSTSETVRACVPKQWFRFAQGRSETAADACSLSILGDLFKGTGYNMKKLIVALTQTPAFLYKTTGGTP